MKRSLLFLGCALLSVLPLSYAASNDKSAEDQKFVDEAARGGKMEVELGQLAQKNSSNDEVKQFGQLMVTDHTRLNQELGEAAKKDGLTVPSELNAKQKAEFQSLSKLSGKTFDEKYSQLMVQDHRNDLGSFQKAESMVKSPDLKKAIDDAIPVIQHHLDMQKAPSRK
jgi:putative membrane protein